MTIIKVVEIVFQVNAPRFHAEHNGSAHHHIPNTRDPLIANGGGAAAEVKVFFVNVFYLVDLFNVATAFIRNFHRVLKVSHK